MMNTMKNVVVKPNFKDGLCPGHPAIPLLESLAKSSKPYTVIMDDFGDVIEFRDSHSSFRLPNITIGGQQFPAPILVAKEIDRCLAQAKIKYIDHTMDATPPQPSVTPSNRDSLLLFVCEHIFKGMIPVPKLNIVLNMSVEQLQQLVFDFKLLDRKLVDDTRNKITEIDAKIAELSNTKATLMHSLTQYNKSIEDFSSKYRELLS